MKNEADNLRDWMEGQQALNHARKIKDYCLYMKQCRNGCVFFNGICSLCGFHPCDWDFKEDNK